MLFNKEFFKKHSGGISPEEIDFWVRVCNQHLINAAKNVSTRIFERDLLISISTQFGQEQCKNLFDQLEAARCFRIGFREAEKKIATAFKTLDDYLMFLEAEAAKNQPQVPVNASLDEMLGAQARISLLEKQLAKCKEQRDYYASLSGASDQIGDELELEAIR